MENFKGYVFTIFSGLFLLAGLLFVALQWARTSDVSVYGYPLPKANTALLVLGSAVGGILTLYLMRLFFRGVRILHKVRSAPKNDAAGPEAQETTEKKDGESDNSLSQ